MAYSYFLTVRGSKQGAFEGEGSSKSKARGISLLGYSLSASAPHGAGSGQASGKRVYEPLSVAKKVGPASTQFFQALVNQEMLDEVALTIYKGGKDGKQTAYFRITLSDALVSGFEHEPGVAYSGELGDTSEVETLSFSFAKIQLENLATGSIVEDEPGGAA